MSVTKTVNNSPQGFLHVRSQEKSHCMPTVSVFYETFSPTSQNVTEMSITVFITVAVIRHVRFN